jgi:hypothetical protein
MMIPRRKPFAGFVTMREMLDCEYAQRILGSWMLPKRAGNGAASISSATGFSFSRAAEFVIRADVGQLAKTANSKNLRVKDKHHVKLRKSFHAQTLLFEPGQPVWISHSSPMQDDELYACKQNIPGSSICLGRNSH